MTWLRWETRWLLVVTACYVVVQPLLFHMHRFLVYDESVYVTQVYPGVTPTGFSAPRARGLPWLISPVSLVSPPLVVIRYYMLVISGVLLFMAFRAWIPVLRMRAVGAAALFATGWLTLFYGTEIYPNLPAAFGEIAAAGYLAQHLSSQFDDRTRRRALAKAAVWVGLVAVVRPTEATWFTLGLLVVTVTRNWRVLLTRWAVLCSFLVIGWLPWVIEAYLRYGGLITRLRSASSNAETDRFSPANAWHYLTLMDGPLQGTTDKTAPVVGYLWWLLLAIGIALAIRLAVRYRDRTALVAACGGVAAAMEYLLLDTVVQARFLLPAYGLLTVCLVAGLPSLPARVPRAGAWVAISVLFAAFAGWNLNTARGIEADQYVRAQQSLELGKVLHRASPHGPCFFASQFGFPEISFASRCSGTDFSGPDTAHIFLPFNPGSAPVYVLTVTNPDKLAIRPVPGTVRKLRGISPGWWLWVAPRDSLVKAPKPLSRDTRSCSPPRAKYR